MNIRRSEIPDIVPVMVGTAGHVDHGKTMLVKALTGCDTDTLPEEKKRGLSINLGFAPCKLPGKRVVGIVDVPGHEDFIKNMVAGAASIDVLVLVISADDGIMPQTREHLKIVSLLHTPVVMAAITKIDLVDTPRRDEVKNDVADFLARHGYPDAPIIMVSTITGEGVDSVRNTINQLVERIRPGEEAMAFRMNIERSFSVKGYGAVVTGIPLSGRCAIGDQLEVLPGRIPTVVRTLQKFKYASVETQAHICSAINIRNIDSNTLERGMALATPGVYRETFSATVSVKNVHESITIKRQTKFRLHYGTSAVSVDALLVDQNVLLPGESGFMRVRSDGPMVLAAGDKFIMRTLSPGTTVGGGAVVTIRNQKRTKKNAAKTEARTEVLKRALHAMENNDPFLCEALAGDSAVVNKNDLPYLFQCPTGRTDEIAAEKKRLGLLLPLGPSHWIIQNRMNEIEETIGQILGRYHKENKYSSGMPVANVCKSLGVDKSCDTELSSLLGHSMVIKVHERYYSLHGFLPSLNDRQRSIKENILKKVVQSTGSAPALGDLQQELGASDADMRLLVRLLQEEGAITLIDRHLFYNGFIQNCLTAVVGIFEKKGSIELQSFREETGLSRNSAVPILELFDARGITRRENKGRILVRNPEKIV